MFKLGETAEETGYKTQFFRKTQEDLSINWIKLGGLERRFERGEHCNCDDLLLPGNTPVEIC